MKFIRVFKGKGNKENNLFINFSNSLITFDNASKKYTFKSHFYPSDEVNYCEIFLNDMSSEFIEKTLKIILKLSSKQITKVSNEETIIYPDQVEKAEASFVNALFWLQYKENLSIFEFVTDIFIKLLNSHYLTNGNKRLASLFLYNFLWECGYFFYFSKGSSSFIEKYIIDIKDFVEKLENEQNIENISKEIIKWIKTRVVIGLNFRSKKYLDALSDKNI